MLGARCSPISTTFATRPAEPSAGHVRFYRREAGVSDDFTCRIDGDKRQDQRAGSA